MTQDQFEYDVALSFAGEDWGIVDEFANHLRAAGIKVLYDDSKTVELGGSDFVTHVAEIVRTKAGYCVLFISKDYPLKKWTKTERTAVQEHALRDANEYILPVRLDDTQVPGIGEAKGYRDLRQYPIESIADFLAQKLAEKKAESGPPNKSHDLRSGHVSSMPSKPDR